MYEVLLIIFLIVAISLIFLIMIQQSHGTDVGISFSGISNLFFGSSGLNTFITRTTKILSALFLIISLVLCNFSKNEGRKKQSEWVNLTSQTEKTEHIYSEVLTKNDIPQ